MSYDAESKRDLLPDKQESIEKSVDEDSHLRSNSQEFKQTATSQNHPNVTKYQSASTSTNNDENDPLTVPPATLLPASGKAETEENDDKYGAVKTIDNSRIAKETRNHSEVKSLSFLRFDLSFSLSYILDFSDPPPSVSILSNLSNLINLIKI